MEQTTYSILNISHQISSKHTKQKIPTETYCSVFLQPLHGHEVFLAFSTQAWPKETERGGGEETEESIGNAVSNLSSEMFRNGKEMIVWGSEDVSRQTNRSLTINSWCTD